MDGPVAGAALRALDARNVNLALPYASAIAEAEITQAFALAQTARGQGAEAKALADRWFMETVVRLHRVGERAPYTGLKPAGTDFGPSIPAAERALASGEAGTLTAMLAQGVQHGLAERFERARARGRPPPSRAPQPRCPMHARG